MVCFVFHVLVILSSSAFAQQKCEGIFSGSNPESILTQLAELRIDSEESQNHLMSVSIMNLFKKKMVEAQKMSIDVSQVPAYVDRLRKERANKVLEEAQRVKKAEIAENYPISWTPIREVTFEERADCSELTPDGKYLVRSANADIKVFDVNSGKVVRKFHIPTNYLKKIAISPDSKLLAYTSPYGETAVLDLSTGQEIHKLIDPPHIDHMIFSKDGKNLIAVTGSYTRVWPARPSLLRKMMFRTSKPILEFQHQIYNVFHIELNPAGNRLLISGNGGTALWDLEKKTEVFHNTSVFNQSYFDPRNENLLVVYFSVGNNKFYEGYDVTTNSKVWTTPGKSSNQNFVFAGDGSQFITIPEYSLNTLDIWDTETGKFIGTNTASLKEGQSLRSLHKTPDGRYVITFIEDNKAIFWERQAYEE
jgi:WD40 repeat protein